MKTIIITIAIFSATIFSYSHAYGSNPMNKFIEKGISFSNSEFPNNKSDFVRVSFRINKENKIEIIDTNSSNEIIKGQLLDKLSKLTLLEAIDTEKIYFYNFTFNKI